MNTATFTARLPLYLRLIRMDKPIGSLLLLWPTLNALWIASHGRPSLALFVIFVLGTVLMRSAGCAINDYADRDFDRHVKRTAQRPPDRGPHSCVGGRRDRARAVVPRVPADPAAQRA